MYQFFCDRKSKLEENQPVKISCVSTISEKRNSAALICFSRHLKQTDAAAERRRIFFSILESAS